MRKFRLFLTALIMTVMGVSSANAQIMIETDLTKDFESLATTKWTGSSGQVGWAAPKVKTNSGLEVAAWERYDGNCTGTGEIMSSTVTGLSAGTYKIELYGAAAFTFDRGFGSTAFTGDLSVAKSESYTEGQSIDNETGVSLYAATSEGTYSKEIPIWYATNFNSSGLSTVVLDGVVVGSNGEIKIGMSKTSTSTNWHVIQLKGVTATVDAVQLYNKALENAKSYQDVDMAADVKQTLNTTIAAYEAKTLTTAAEYEAAIAELNEVIKSAEAAAEAYKLSKYFIDFAAGNYYVIDDETGLMMAAGHNYGTRGIVNELGLDLTLTPNAEKHSVTFDSQVSNGGNNHFLGTNLYMDAAAFGWYLEAQGTSFYITNGTQYIGLDADNNLVMSDTPRKWNLMTAEDVKKERLEGLAVATAETPVDATFLISGANFSRNDARNNKWETWSEKEGGGTNLNISGGNQTNNCAESFHAKFFVKQTIEGAPAGIYKLTAQGFYRQDDDVTEETPIFFANDITAGVPAKAGSEANMSDASNSFTQGTYTIDPIEFEVGEDGTFTVGIKNETALHQWIIFDNFQLTYCGPNTSTAINEVAEKAAPKTIFNVAGQQMNGLQKGLNIVDGKKLYVK